MSLERRIRTLQIRREWRDLSVKRLEQIEPGDLKHMLGMLAQLLADRRRECELDELRCERFHAEDEEMLAKSRQQRIDIDRRLEITSGLLKLVGQMRCEDSLKDLLLAWSKNVPLIEPERLP